MKVRVLIPFECNLQGPTTASLTPETEFPSGAYTIRVSLMGGEEPFSEIEDGNEVFIRPITHIRLQIEEADPGVNLGKLVRENARKELLELLTKLANRVLRAIRNTAWMRQAQEIVAKPWNAEWLLRKWECEVIAPNGVWALLYPTASPLFGFLYPIGQSYADLSADKWPAIQEAIHDNPPPRPEQEFLTNALEHLHSDNFRLAVLEAALCLDIVINQFLMVFLRVEKGLSKERIKNLVNPDVGLSARASVLLKLILSPTEVSEEKIGQVLRLIKWRNTIVHKTGHLPSSLPDEHVWNCVFASLELALVLGRKRDQLEASPEMQELAQSLATAHGLSAPSIRLVPPHGVVVSFFIPVLPLRELPSAEQITEIVGDISQRLQRRDKWFVRDRDLRVTFGGLLGGGASATWSHGKLEISNPPSSSSIRGAAGLPS